MTPAAISRAAMITFLPAFMLALSACEEYEDPAPATDGAEVRDATPWPVYGGDGARHYADSGLITAANVKNLKPAWSHHNGDVSAQGSQYRSTSAFEVTPILVDGIMYFCSVFNRVIAIDPATGAEHWSHDPNIDKTAYMGNQFVCRGVTYWRDEDAAEGATCATRIFTATGDSRLIALDAKTGERCVDFGNGGEIDTMKGVGEPTYHGQYHHTSPPAVIGNNIVVGSAIGDNSGTAVPSGVVRAWDARDGHLVWAQDLAPPNYDYETDGVSEDGYALATPNVWAPMIADEDLNLLYAPTGNPSPDYFRTGEPDMDYYGSGLAALDGSTGEIVWFYQFVHNDFWDFDTSSQPTLFELERDGETIPAVAQGTKMGFIFILDRRTGKTLFPVEERPVPQDTDVPLSLSPTQPWPTLPKSVAHNDLEAGDAFGLTFWDRGKCRELLASLKYDGMFTPPSTEWTLMFTGNVGGINWGGLAIDPERGILVVNSSNMAWMVRLIPKADYDSVSKANPGREIAAQRGTDYGLWREFAASPIGVPCNPTPWGVLTGIDLATGKQLWQSTLGTTRDLAPVPIPLKTGTPTLGGPLVTKSGLTFIGAALDNYIRAFDNATGEEIWSHRLPAPAVATPMSYMATGPDGKVRQYIVIASGGHGKMPMDMSDTLVAFTLDD